MQVIVTFNHKLACFIALGLFKFLSKYKMFSVLAITVNSVNRHIVY